MEFLKSLFSAIVDIAVGPVIRLRHVMSMTKTELVITAGDIASRVAIVASFFFAVPALLVTLAWVWVILSPIVIMVITILTFVSLGFSLDAIAKMMAKAKTPDDEVDVVVGKLMAKDMADLMAKKRAGVDTRLNPAAS